VGRASVIINDESQKKIIFHPAMQPGHVIADPEVTYGLPSELTAFTGIDAWVHAFEAFCAPMYHPMADGIALEAMRLIYDNLEDAVREPENEVARTQMILASSMGATAFQKGLGVVHALSHALGGRLKIHHGLANAILLPYCMKKNRPVIAEKCARVAQHQGLADASFESLLQWVLGLRERVGVPNTLAEVEGMTEELCVELAPIAFRDPTLGTNPQPLTTEELVVLYRQAFFGL
ncbi:MAG: iron-containing alcohol dehydrogenase, partial [Polyangiaceae bacterium]|nr:iron-containing alcohol dehydrogenase [Polyangiaceae bacterium]